MPIDTNISGSVHLGDDSLSQAADTESRMRRSLGPDGHLVTKGAPLQPYDPLRGARNAIRSQAAAKEYAERQLAHAQRENEQLRTSLHLTRREKASVVEALRSAITTKAAAEIALKSSREALAEQKSACERCDRALGDARATILNLQAKLDTAGGAMDSVTKDLAAERQARKRIEEQFKELIAAQAHSASAAAQEPRLSDNLDQPEKMAQLVEDLDDPERSVIPVAKRPVGRPRKTADASVVAATTQRRVVKTDRTGTTAEAVGERVILARPTVPSVKRPVGRPRKNADTSPVAVVLGRKAAHEAGSQKLKAKRQPIADQEPVQWWVSGWKNRWKST